MTELLKVAVGDLVVSSRDELCAVAAAESPALAFPEVSIYMRFRRACPARRGAPSGGRASRRLHRIVGKTYSAQVRRQVSQPTVKVFEAGVVSSFARVSLWPAAAPSSPIVPQIV